MQARLKNEEINLEIIVNILVSVMRNIWKYIILRTCFSAVIRLQAEYIKRDIPLPYMVIASLFGKSVHI